MKVYRLEDKEGKGPWASGVAYGHHYDPPGPMDDGIFGSYDDYWEMCRNSDTSGIYDYRYGFQSKTKLKDWFKNSDLKYFKRVGLDVKMYEVPTSKVKLGGWQCAFKPEDAYSSKKIPLKRVLH